MQPHVNNSKIQYNVTLSIIHIDEVYSDSRRLFINQCYVAYRPQVFIDYFK